MGRQGGCLCGKIRYEMTGEPLAVVICHCINCQKQSGSAFSINLVGMSGQVSLQGEMASYEDESDLGEPVRRNFCKTCGSPIYSEILTQGDLIALKVGTLDDTSGLEPQSQVWCIRKHDWLSLGADIPEVMKNR